MDSQCKYVLVTRGDADIYLRFPRKNEYRENLWDHAAGALLVEESGGVVTDANGKKLDFSSGRQLLSNTGIIACSNTEYLDKIILAYRL